MAGFGYNPERTITLGEELERYGGLVDEVQERREAGESDGVDWTEIDGLPDNPRSEPSVLRTGIAWCADRFGEDATVTLRALSAGTRADLSRYLETQRVGSVGSEGYRTHVCAATVVEAPWLDTTYEGAEDLGERVEILREAPPQVLDWLATEADRLNDLSVKN